MFTIDFPSERTIEDYIFQRLSEGDPCPITDEIVTFALRQLEIRGYGTADIVKITIWPQGVSIKVLELKNETLKEAHLGQLARYMRGIERAARKYRRLLPEGWELDVSGELAGPFDANANNLVHLIQYLPKNISVHQIYLDMDIGFVAEEVSRGWYNTGESTRGYKKITRKVYEFASQLIFEMKARESASVVQMGARRG